METVGEVLASPDHATWVAEGAGQVAGFVSGFATVAADRTRRWEIDLLAVAAAWRGRGLGSGLIAASMVAGQARGLSVARALVATNNQASQRAFARCGFVPDTPAHRVFIWSRGPLPHDEAGDPCHLIPVRTLAYSGLWAEPPLTPAGLATAQRTLLAGEGSLVGAVVSLADDPSAQAASQMGFQPLAQAYRWWRCALPSAPRP